jgi:hypothetical protein
MMQASDYRLLGEKLASQGPRSGPQAYLNNTVRRATRNRGGAKTKTNSVKYPVRLFAVSGNSAW